MTALLWCDKMYKNISKKLLHLTIEFFYKKLCAVPLDIPRSGVILVKYANEQLDNEQFEI